MKRRILFTASFLIFLTVDLMLLGAGVRALDAGLACPDWPLCFGKIVPDLHLGVWMEFLHRAIAGILMILFTVFWVMLYFEKSTQGSPRWWAAFGFFILIAQAIMGALTVLKLLDSGIVVAHLALATIFLVTLVLLRKALVARFEGEAARSGVNASALVGVPSSVARGAVASSVPRRVVAVAGSGSGVGVGVGVGASATARAPMGVRIFAFVLPVAVFLQILLGGWVASTYSGMVCLDFPLCTGKFIPTLQGPLGIQVMHRLGAYALTLLIFAYGVWIFMKRHEGWITRRHRQYANLAIAMVLVQIGLGVINLLLLIPPWMTVIHLFGALVLLKFTLEITSEAYQLERRYEERL
jgi:cytochrome c oxidase assembly protein subunit 15